MKHDYTTRARALALRALELGHAMRAIALWQAAELDGGVTPLDFN